MKSIPFFKVCKLLDDLDAIFCRTIPLLPQTRIQKVGDAWIDWFRSNRDTLDAMHKDDVSVLFTLKPEILEDRDYNIYDETKFERFLARALCMGVNERKRYAKFVEEFNGGRNYLAVPSKTGLGLDEIVRNDIGYRVERIMKETGRDEATNLLYKKVTLEEIEDTLIIIAANNEGSSDLIKCLKLDLYVDKYPLERLGEIYSRLQASQAKWLTRILFKDLGFKVPEDMILSAYHTSLPRLLTVRANFNIQNLVPARRDGDSGWRFAHVPPNKNQENSSKPSLGKKQMILTPLVNQPTKVLQLGSPPATKPLPLSESTASSLNTTKRLAQQLPPPSSNNNVKLPSKTSARQTQTSPRALPPKRSQTSPHKPTTRSPLTHIFSGTSKCLQAPTNPPTSCLFHNTLFILAPCITTHLFLTENLLASHSCTYITSLQPLTRKLLPKRCPQTGRRARKIALVEYNRREQMIAFMRQIEGLGLKRSCGKHDWIEVVDWRLVEKIGKVEKSGEGLEEVWRRYRIGFV